MTGFNTTIIHTQATKKDVYGALHVPIYGCASFEFDSAENIELAFNGKKLAHSYSRITNPTVEHLENKIRKVTGAIGTLALSSGMAAIANLILAIAGKGDNIITSKYLFGNTYGLFDKTLKSWGLETRYVNFANMQSLEKKIDKRTRGIFLESITNPALQVADLRKISQVAKKRNVLLIVDSTATPLYFAKLQELGVNVEVISSTKYISGGATSIGGLIIDHGTFDWSQIAAMYDSARKFGPNTLLHKLRTEVFRNIGACLSPHNAYLQSLGLDTLGLRIEKSCRNTLDIAQFLKKQQKVKQVNYPGLKDSENFQIITSQFNGLGGSILTFKLDNKQDCFSFMNKLTIIRRATNIHDNKSLIIHPASTIFCEYDDELKKEMGVPDTLLRLSVGIEDVEDLIEDISAALGEL